MIHNRGKIYVTPNKQPRKYNNYNHNNVWNVMNKFPWKGTKKTCSHSKIQTYQKKSDAASRLAWMLLSARKQNDYNVNMRKV